MTPEEKIAVDNLERISEKIQDHIKDLNKTFDLVIPLANKFGYTISRKTGELIKYR